jgi:hypothetical protein
MTFDSFYVLAQLQALEQHITDTPACVESLRLAYAHQDRAEILCSRVDGERLLSAMAITTARLKSRIITTDGLGDRLESLAELAVRAVRMVLLTELADLRDVVGGSDPRGVPRTWCTGRFRRLDDLLAFLYDELDRITRMWSGYRDRPWIDRVAFRAALHAASRAMQQLGKMPALVHFLREGSARHDWPALAEICARIRAALAIGIAVEPEHPLVRHTQRLHELTIAEQL